MNTHMRPPTELRTPHSVVWNSRAPYASFLEYHEHLNNHYRTTSLAYSHIREIISKLPQERLLIEALAHLNAKQRDKQAIQKIAATCERVGDLEEKLRYQYEILDQSLLVQISSLFEAFSICWSCNMLLATLENGDQLTYEQSELVHWVAKKGRTPPPRQIAVNNGPWIGGLTQIINAFPSFRSQLEGTSRRIKDPRTKRAEVSPCNPDVGALRVIEFWQDFRNLVVHSRRIVTREFHKKHSHVWGLLRSDLQHVPRLMIGYPVPLNAALVTASFTTHQVLAKAMRDMLIKYSKEKRGHVFSPGPFRGALRPHEMPPIPPLRLTGDW
jgi:hypothetical protein